MPGAEPDNRSFESIGTEECRKISFLRSNADTRLEFEQCPKSRAHGRERGTVASESVSLSSILETAMDNDKTILESSPTW